MSENDEKLFLLFLPVLDLGLASGQSGGRGGGEGKWGKLRTNKKKGEEKVAQSGC
jgi:hypothetical protein